MGVLTRILDFLPTYFKTDPEKVAVFTIEHSSPTALMRYSIADDMISAKSFGSFSDDFNISLAGKTIQQVVDEINAVPDYTATIFSGPESINAIRLVDIEKTGDPTVYYHQNSGWALFKAIALELKEAKIAGDELLRQMGIPSATGILSNHWGSYFNIGRLTDETDAVYNQRIIDSLVRPKSNNVAMEIVLEAYYGYEIDVFDLDYLGSSSMLMNNIPTPVHNRNYPIMAANTIGKELCVFGVRFPVNTISHWNQAQFDELQELIYDLRAAGTRPKLFWTDAPIFTPAEIPYNAGPVFYTKYL